MNEISLNESIAESEPVREENSPSWTITAIQVVGWINFTLGIILVVVAG